MINKFKDDKYFLLLHRISKIDNYNEITNHILRVVVTKKLIDKYDPTTHYYQKQ
jgi:hypothetical protein